MRIRYAVSTMVFWWRETYLSFEQECEYLKSLGFGIELWPTRKDDNDCRYTHRNWTRLSEATKGMLVSMNSRNDGPTITEWIEQIECAKMLGAHIVADLRSLCISQDLGLADWAFAAEVVKVAADQGVTICLETGSLPALLQVGEKFDSIRYCLDTGYAYLDHKNGFTEYVDRLAERTTHLHLTDNYGTLDDHEPPGVRGGMARDNWDYLLNGLAKYDNDVIGSLEMFPCMPSTMIRQSSKFLFNVMHWPDQPQPEDNHHEKHYRPL
jgi:sugar phosphate isomerase/epimerase